MEDEHANDPAGIHYGTYIDDCYACEVERARESRAPRTRRRHPPNIVASTRPRSVVKLNSVSAIGSNVGAPRTRAKSAVVK